MKGEIPDNVKIEACNDVLLNLVSVCKSLLYIAYLQLTCGSTTGRYYSLLAAVPRGGITAYLRLYHGEVFNVTAIKSQ